MELLERIGVGGMGAVYRARQVSMDRVVAVKTIRSRARSDASMTRRILREAQVLGRLNHPHIVQVHDAFLEQGLYFLVMEYLAGGCLRQYSLSLPEGRLGIAEGARLFLEAAEALEVAEKRNIIHRDIKPANLLLDESLRLKVVDFGIAKQLEGNTVATDLSGLIGTPLYMSPEQCLGNRLDARSDMYSLAATFFHLTTGVRPVPGATKLTEIIQGKQKIQRLLSRKYREDIPRPLDDLIRRMTEQDPDRRPRSFSEVVETLQAYRDSMGSSSRRPAGPSEEGPAPAPQVELSSRYELGALLGTGGMGKVFAGVDRKSGLAVAIKRMRSGGDASLPARFLREAGAIQRLRHPRIVACLEYGVDAEGPWLALERVGDGRTLHDQIESEGPLAGADRRRLIEQLCDALEHSHRHGLVHRDVKPRNILLDPEGNFKLTDFGLVRDGLSYGPSATQDLLGTPEFAAPEQSGDPRRVDHRSDIFALARTLCHAITGKSPTLLRESLLPEELRRPLLRALEERPEDRFFSIREFRDACLGEAAAPAAPKAPSSPPAAPPPPEPPRVTSPPSPPRVREDPEVGKRLEVADCQQQLDEARETQDWETARALLRKLYQLDPELAARWDVRLKSAHRESVAEEAKSQGWEALERGELLSAWRHFNALQQSAATGTLHEEALRGLEEVEEKVVVIAVRLEGFLARGELREAQASLEGIPGELFELHPRLNAARQALARQVRSRRLVRVWGLSMVGIVVAIAAGWWLRQDPAPQQDSALARTGAADPASGVPPAPITEVEPEPPPLESGAEQLNRWKSYLKANQQEFQPEDAWRLFKEPVLTSAELRESFLNKHFAHFAALRDATMQRLSNSRFEDLAGSMAAFDELGASVTSFLERASQAIERSPEAGVVAALRRLDTDLREQAERLVQLCGQENVGLAVLLHRADANWRNSDATALGQSLSLLRATDRSAAENQLIDRVAAALEERICSELYLRLVAQLEQLKIPGIFQSEHPETIFQNARSTEEALRTAGPLSLKLDTDLRVTPSRLEWPEPKLARLDAVLGVPRHPGENPAFLHLRETWSNARALLALAAAQRRRELDRSLDAWAEYLDRNDRAASLPPADPESHATIQQLFSDVLSAIDEDLSARADALATAFSTETTRAAAMEDPELERLSGRLRRVEELVTRTRAAGFLPEPVPSEVRWVMDSLWQQPAWLEFAPVLLDSAVPLQRAQCAWQEIAFAGKDDTIADRRWQCEWTDLLCAAGRELAAGLNLRSTARYVLLAPLAHLRKAPLLPRDRIQRIRALDAIVGTRSGPSPWTLAMEGGEVEDWRLIRDQAEDLAQDPSLAAWLLAHRDALRDLAREAQAELALRQVSAQLLADAEGETARRALEAAGRGSRARIERHWQRFEQSATGFQDFAERIETFLGRRSREDVVVPGAGESVRCQKITERCDEWLAELRGFSIGTARRAAIQKQLAELRTQSVEQEEQMRRVLLVDPAAGD